MEKKRVLHILNWLNYGGAERFLLNLTQYVDKDKFQFDIMVRNSKNPMSSDFEDHGVTIIEAPDFPRNLLEHYRYFKGFVREHGYKYDYVHVHANSLIYTWPISIFNKYAKDTQIILHSHSSLSTSQLVSKVHQFNRNVVNKMVNIKIAASELAGRWMFNEEHFNVIYNGIDVNKFLFNKVSRDQVRKTLRVSDDEILLGIVGRLAPVKNHEYIIDILSILKINSGKNYKLVIAGDGELEAEIKKKVKDKGLQQQVIFTGSINDIPGVLSAIDIYLQPSLFEGFPFTVVEAQVSNLPVLISDRISTEVIISDKLVQLSLEDITAWVDTILNVKKNPNRGEYKGIDIEKIDMKNIANDFENNIYL